MAGDDIDDNAELNFDDVDINPTQGEGQGDNPDIAEGNLDDMRETE